MMNQINQNQILQSIQKNNEQIIQMIQQIFEVQMRNNMLLNQFFNYNLNNNINNNSFNNMMNQMNNMDMIKIDPWVGNTEPKLNIEFRFLSGKKIMLAAPDNISIKELIERFWKKSGITDPIEQKKISFSHNGHTLNIADSSPISKNFVNGSWVLVNGIHYK